MWRGGPIATPGVPKATEEPAAPEVLLPGSVTEFNLQLLPKSLELELEPVTSSTTAEELGGVKVTRLQLEVLQSSVTVSDSLTEQ